jgi:hypothetical protein
MLSLKLRRIFENRVLRRIFGPMRDDVTGSWRKLHNEEHHNFVRFEVFTAVTMKNAIFWDIMLCGLLEPTFQKNVAPPSSR